MLKKLTSVSILLVSMSLAPMAAYAATESNVAGVASTPDNGDCKGVVVDNAGEPIIGASVRVKGTTNGAVTDMDGNFSIAGVQKGSTLVVSFVGFTTKEVVWNGQPLKVAISDDQKALDEVVVTALGIKRQSRSLGYSTTKVGGDEFQLVRDPNIGNALSGKVAGVSVAGNATGSGGSSRVIIRGNASITGNNMPLYVVDGVPFDNTNQGSSGQWGGSDGGDGLGNINADDIEDIQVLKGAAASALYGFRGGNGAILITTKSGKKNQPVQIEVNENVTFNTIYDQRDFQKEFGVGKNGQRPTDQKMAFDEMGRNNWGEALGNGTFVNSLGQTRPYEYVDNFDQFYRTGVTNNVSAAVSGGSDKMTYRVGLSHSYEKSQLPNAGQSQIGINLAGTYDIFKNVHLSVNANYVFDKRNGQSNLSDGNGNTNATVLWMPNGYNISDYEREPGADWGSYLNGNEYRPFQSVYISNPYFTQYRRTKDTNRNRLTGSINLKWDITDYLYVQGAVQRDGYTLERKEVTPLGSAADETTGFMSEYMKTYAEMNYNFLLGFDKEFGDWHVGASFGGNKLDNTWKQYTVIDGGRPFIVNGFWSANNIDPTSTGANIGYASYQVNSLYFTAEAGWRNQVFLNVTGRNDWFSTLAKNSNSYFYPSVNVSWVFTDSFRKAMPDWFDFGKVRAGYASASNGTSPYQGAMAYTIKNYTVNGQMLATTNNNVFPNANLKPVQISEFEVGLNLGFFNNRLNFDMAYYVKNTKDDIVKVSTSNASGFDAAIKNIGEIKNKGFEFMVDATPVYTKDWRWNTTLNFAYNDSEVLSLGDDGKGNAVERLAIDGATPNGFGNFQIQNVVGKAYGQLVGYHYKRDAEGNLLLKDGLPQNDGVMTEFGSGVHKWTGGWRNSITWKDLTLSFLIDFKAGAKLFSGSNVIATSNGLHKNTLVGRSAATPCPEYVFPGIDEDTMKPNTKPMPNTTAVQVDQYWSQVVSRSIAEEFVYDASFIKLRELSLTYNFPKNLLAKQRVFKGISVSLVARNLWTILKYTDNIDPESSINNTNGQGLELNGYPYSRNIGLNVNLKF